jgi:hypothetical protein
MDLLASKLGTRVSVADPACGVIAVWVCGATKPPARSTAMKPRSSGQRLAGIPSEIGYMQQVSAGLPSLRIPGIHRDPAGDGLEIMSFQDSVEGSAIEG